MDADGNLLIATGGLIRRVDADTGIITTVAGGGSPPSGNGDGGLATDAELGNPCGVTVDSVGNIFIADDDRDRIRRVDATTGIITTYAGTGDFGFSGDGGPSTSATFKFPSRVAVDAQDNLFIADLGNVRIRRVDADTGIITTVAGGGSPPSGNGDGGLATDAELSFALGLEFDPQGNLFVTDNGRIRRVDAATQIITTIAGIGGEGFGGDGGLAINAAFDDPWDVAVDGFGNLTITDVDNSRIRRVFLGVPGGHQPINIDIKPGSFPNSINLSSGGATPVAILGSATLNVLDVDELTLTLGTSGIKTVGRKDPHLMCSIEDVSGDFSGGPEGIPDGYDDLVCHFVTVAIVPEEGDTEAKLSGNLFDGTLIEGSDSVNIVP